MARFPISRTLAEGIENSIILAKVLGVDHPNITFYSGLLKESDKVEKQCGTLTSIKVFKYWYNIAVRTVMKEPIDEKSPIFTRTNKRGIPQIMMPIVKYLERKSSSVLLKRVMLTALRSYELVQVAVRPDLSTIEAESEGPQNFKVWKNDFESYLDYSGFGQMVKKDFRSNLSNMIGEGPISFHYTTKSGISGSSLGTAATQSLYFKDRPEILANLESLNSYFFPEEELTQILEDNQNFILDGFIDLVEPKEIGDIINHSGRLAFVPDKGGKTRCVAIGNYWIQNTLKPLHSVMFETLRHIAMDGTFDQISQSSRVAKATEDGPVWSYDLTAATDRLPLEIQESVMKFLHIDIGNIWSKILRSLTFSYKGREVKYAVGQPMGFYSSWASLALTHHFIIQYCSYLEGYKSTFLDYAVLGDDVAIWNKQIALRYEKIIKNLGVDISQAKSYIPRDRQIPWKAEFAKRHYIQGIEVSGIGANVLKEGFKEFWALPELFTFLVKHGLSELVHIPISRVVKVLKLKLQDTRLLSCAFHVNEILGGPSFTMGLPSDAVINEFISSVSTTVLLEERIEILMESVSDIWEDLFSLDTKDGEDLESIYDTGKVPTQLVIKRVLETRRMEILELEDRMLYLIPEEKYPHEADYVLPTKPDIPLKEYQDNVLTKLKDIEFVPSIRLSELLKGIESHTDRKRYRVLFLKKLVRKLWGASLKSVDDF